MKHRYIIRNLFFLGSILLFFSCQSKQEKTTTTPDNTQGFVLRVDDQKTFQTIDNFGASDAWSGQFVGNWPSEKKGAIADLLFSQELDENGNPKGIGLSLWRFNVGAGSAEQGSQSGIGDTWRRAESFLEADGTYNWNKQKGQVWFARAAQERGVDKLLLFPNSPPVHITKNGKAFSDSGQESNLAPENYTAFGAYLAEVTQGLQNMGLTVDYISPVNEPQWDWADGGQEGTPFWNDEIAGIVRALNQELEHRSLDVQIDVSEAGKINYLYEQGDRPGRSRLIDAFFDQGSDNYIGDLSHVGNAISGHSYFTTSPFSNSIEIRKELASAVQAKEDLKFWMSEYCILGDNNGDINGNGRDLGMESALYMAKVIHSDLAIAQASAWHWWLAVSPYDYKDGLVYIDHNQDDGAYYESKMLWTLGNYSRFIRPGFQRISVENPNSESIDEDFLFSGYKNPDNGELVLVLVNSGAEAIDVELDFNQDTAMEIKSFTTSSEMDLQLQEVQDNGPVVVPEYSIVTITTQNM